MGRDWLMRPEVCETNLTQIVDTRFTYLSIKAEEELEFEPLSYIHGFRF